MELSTTSDLTLTCYRLEKIPDSLYNNWREICWNMKDTRVMQMAVLRMLKAYFWVRHPLDKLCAFEDFSREEAKGLDLEPGMYVIFRRMTDGELVIHEQAKEGKIHADEDPQWILEAPDLKPYLNDNYQTDSIDHPERPRWLSLQGELRD